jgi:adenylate cyclase
VSMAANRKVPMLVPEVPDDLLAGLAASERQARATLLRWLLERGVGVEELRAAADAHGLPLLPAEVVLRRDCRYSLAEAADRAGLSLGFIQRVWRVGGIPIPQGEEPILDDEDVQALRLARQVLDAGLSEDAYVEISRVVGRGAAPTADALVEVSIEHFLGEHADDEARFAMRLEEIAEQLIPLLPTLLAFPVRMQVRDAVRRQAVQRSGEGVGALAGTRRMAIAFADLVAFTALSERESLAATSAIAARLETLASDAAVAPVRLVKLIGDAAMFVSDDAAELVRALFAFKRSADAEDGFAPVRVGVAAGEVMARAGDVYGPAVNLASRLAAAGEPGTVLAAPDLAEALPDGIAARKRPPTEIRGVGEVAPIELVAA